MQSRHDGILRNINHTGGYNILTFPTHERFSSNWATLPHTFYLWRGKGIKGWNEEFAKLPTNHILLSGNENQVLPDIKFDMVLSQNKFGQFAIAHRIAQYLNIPLVSLEHTLPVPSWTPHQINEMTRMRGNINIFISDYSVEEWGFSKEDKSVRVIHHAIDTNLFKPSGDNQHNDGKILSVANDYQNRDWCLNFSLYKKICLDNNLPVNPVGDTPGFSKAAKNVNDLIDKYSQASAFFNTSRISPIPMSLLEAMACACPCVTTATCQIPTIVQDGYNGFISNDENYLKDKLIWCLEHPQEAAVLGKNARKTIEEKFSLSEHLSRWNDIFKEVAGRGFGNEN